MKRHIHGVLRGVNRKASLPVPVSLLPLPHADPADLGVIGLEAGKQTDVSALLMALAVAIHLGQPVRDLRGLGVDLYRDWALELLGGEHRRITTRHRLCRVFYAGHLRHRIRGGSCWRRGGGFLVLTASGSQKNENQKDSLHVPTQRNIIVV
jgi:hypothetical protein